jgi:hypothetical protein
MRTHALHPIRQRPEGIDHLRDPIEIPQDDAHDQDNLRRAHRIVHNVEGTYSMSRMDMVPPTMVTHGTVCLVKNGGWHRRNGGHLRVDGPDA